MYTWWCYLNILLAPDCLPWREGRSQVKFILFVEMSISLTKGIYVTPTFMNLLSPGRSMSCVLLNNVRTRFESSMPIFKLNFCGRALQEPLWYSDTMLYLKRSHCVLMLFNVRVILDHYKSVKIQAVPDLFGRLECLYFSSNVLILP